MKWIVSDFFVRSPVLLGPIVALLLFFVVFSAIAIRTLRTRKSAHEQLARLPFDEGGHD
jgi:hypothetical protein